MDKLPSKEDFEHFDTNGDGTLYYDEWAEAQELMNYVLTKWLKIKSKCMN